MDNRPQEKNSSLVFADLHLHSKYSRAVSAQMDLEGLRKGALQKGLGILSTGDFTHPKWFSVLQKKLVPSDFDGFFFLSGYPDILFALSSEISTIYSDGTGRAGVKKVHHLVYAPTLDIVSQINDVLSTKGNLAADGRPTFGSMSPAHVAELMFEISKDIVLVPAHAWTPWFSVFGSKSGYNSLEDAYQDQARHIFAIETGLSSDPAMNWRISCLDRLALMSNSDSHSPYPWRLGRECNAFTIPRKELSFYSMFKAVKEKDRSRFAFTVEVDPRYGKYHLDGHRDCGVCLEPSQTSKLKGICPVCHRPLTIGVQSRVDELADRPEGYDGLKGAIPFKCILPLHELIAAALSVALSSKKVAAEAEKILSGFPSELFVLLDASKEDLLARTDAKIAQCIIDNREGRIKISPGFDGEYGLVQLGGAKKRRATITSAQSQKSLQDFS